MKHSPSSFARGYILLLALVVSAVVTTVTTGFFNYYVSAIHAERFALASAQAYSLAEAGIDKAVYELNQNGNYSGESNTALGNGTFSVSVASINSSSKRITITSFVPNSTNPTATKIVRATVGIDATVASFYYGVQIGQGGLEMNNSSKVIGNAYSNGNIIGNNSARIQGTAVAAGPTSIIEGMDIDSDAWSHTIRGTSTVGGNATHSVLQNTTVTGNVVADSISGCTIGGTAKYDTRSSCTVTGTVTTPNSDAFVPADILPLPISEAQIDTWEADAVAGGTIGSQTFSDGTRSLGPKKITGDLTMSNDAELVLTGTLWVTGAIKLSNSSKIRLDSSYGDSSGVVIAGIDESSTAGYIEIANSAQALGSGSANSFIMLLSQREMGSEAIKISNSSATAILYAGEGEIEIGNSAALKEVTANKLEINNSATVTYTSGLQNTSFSNGPGGSWAVVPGTYAITQ
jgi:Tfp pilus assembly protein PilX